MVLRRVRYTSGHRSLCQHGQRRVHHVRKKKKKKKKKPEKSFAEKSVAKKNIIKINEYLTRRDGSNAARIFFYISVYTSFEFYWYRFILAHNMHARKPFSGTNALFFFFSFFSIGFVSSSVAIAIRFEFQIVQTQREPLRIFYTLTTKPMSYNRGFSVSTARTNVQMIIFSVFFFFL